jgi:hypothetical protein
MRIPYAALRFSAEKNKLGVLISSEINDPDKIHLELY